jgi:hypothetical protein
MSDMPFTSPEGFEGSTVGATATPIASGGAHWFVFKGDRLLVNCSLPVLPDKDVVLLSVPDGQGHQRAIVRRLVREFDDHWRVKTYSPARTYNEPKAEYPEAHRIEAARGR